MSLFQHSITGSRTDSLIARTGSKNYLTCLHSHSALHWQPDPQQLESDFLSFLPCEFSQETTAKQQLNARKERRIFFMPYLLKGFSYL